MTGYGGGGMCVGVTDFIVHSFEGNLYKSKISPFHLHFMWVCVAVFDYLGLHQT